MMTVQVFFAALGRGAQKLDEVAPELNRLDGQLGDGDLGATLVKCAANVRALDSSKYTDLGQLCKACALACAKASGSSFGTLLTVAFTALARRFEGQADLSWEELPDALQTALDAMSQRGGAKLGDKTVLDALAAAIDAARGLSHPYAQHAAATAAVAAAIEVFRGQPNRIGRARMFGDRSVGIDDPGMIAFQYMLESQAPVGGQGAD
jgi:dihydroxyacetone kinase-like protein